MDEDDNPAAGEADSRYVAADRILLPAGHIVDGDDSPAAGEADNRLPAADHTVDEGDNHPADEADNRLPDYSCYGDDSRHVADHTLPVDVTDSANRHQSPRDGNHLRHHSDDGY